MDETKKHLNAYNNPNDIWPSIGHISESYGHLLEKLLLQLCLYSCEITIS